MIQGLAAFAAKAATVAGVGAVTLVSGRVISLLQGEQSPRYAIIAAIVGIATALVFELGRTVRDARRDRLKVFQVVDEERDNLFREVEKVHQRELEFLEVQLAYHTQLESIARNRSHKAAHEIQRLILEICRVQNDLLRHNAKIPLEYRFEGVEIRLRTAEEIWGSGELPMLPATNKNIDHQGVK